MSQLRCFLEGVGILLTVIGMGCVLVWSMVSDCRAAVVLRCVLLTTLIAAVGWAIGMSICHTEQLH